MKWIVIEISKKYPDAFFKGVLSPYSFPYVLQASGRIPAGSGQVWAGFGQVLGGFGGGLGLYTPTPPPPHIYTYIYIYIYIGCARPF